MLASDDEPWSGVDPLVRESRRWLEGRLPEGLGPTGEGNLDDVPVLCWGTPKGGLCLWFESPHRIRFHRFRRGTAPDRDHEGRFNIAMNIQEIIDMIRETTEDASGTAP